ncbi:hypothetical protein HLRTI_001592 [Halorhabdus tiamatea SARL4B]|uniref:Conserved hypothetical membrane protein (DUF373) n=1 Tax=Halorhabdus tiamatea SARL4B TaxID=1033806 RepID=S6D3U3_9EURY|nr:DUF373 family protein [Halorhabdus tiamatea]ERJ06387.1 hypothetical protein HLRTI_001592 [Halorhabdus tiamatea SARL4B]CCQ34555.1 conserved hypothetical membrane protein (DUF373) [Halorhabdus tiamatea SARL4B]
MTTLVVCLDRGGDFTSVADPPIVGVEAVESLVTEFGVGDPEDSRVNCLLEGLRVARDLESDGEEAVMAVISGRGETVGVSRAVARQTEQLLDEHEPDSAIVITDSTEDERLVPIIESRVPVDAVDRVVVRQAHDIESTYYLLKQFLADEELRETVLVPIGAALLAMPILLLVVNSVTMALGAIAAAIGLLLLYKGLGIDEYVETLPGQIHSALYSGQVSLVTYVVAVGLALIGLFVGALGMSTTGSNSVLILAMRFGFDAITWLTAAALAASTGRLLDELLRHEGVRNAYLNLPFAVVAIGLVVRGVTGYFLERANVLASLTISKIDLGVVSVEGFTLAPGTRLAIFLLAGIVVSLVGVRFAAYFSETNIEEELVETPAE